MPKWATMILWMAAVVASPGCALAADDGGGGGGDGGGIEIRYCEEDHRGDLNEARCYDEPDGDR